MPLELLKPAPVASGIHCPGSTEHFAAGPNPCAAAAAAASNDQSIGVTENKKCFSMLFDEPGDKADFGDWAGPGEDGATG